MTSRRMIGYEIAKVHKALRAKLQEFLSPYDVTVQQFEVLRILREDPGITAAQLVERIISDSSTMMSILKRLESKALIIRKVDENDRRTKRIFFTEKGQHLVEKLTVLGERYNCGLLGCCAAEELQVFRRVLSTLYAYSRVDDAGAAGREK